MCHSTRLPQVAFSVLLIPYCAGEIYVVKHFHEDVKSLKFLILFQGLVLVLCVASVAVLFTWISAVGVRIVCWGAGCGWGVA